jgi:hypothetical protein
MGEKGLTCLDGQTRQLAKRPEARMDCGKQKIVERTTGSCVDRLFVLRREGFQSRSRERLFQPLERIENFVIVFGVIKGCQDNCDCTSVRNRRFPPIMAFHPGLDVSLFELGHGQRTAVPTKDH